MTSLGFLKNEVEFIRLFKVVNKLDNGVIGSLAQIIKLDFFEHLLTIEGPTVLVDNFDCVLDVGVHVDASLDTTIATFTQNIILNCAYC